MIVVACAMTACATSGDTRPIANTRSALIIFREDWNFSTNVSPQLIVALWEDGSVVWSSNPIEGGPPYRKGRIERETVSRLLASVDDALEDQALQRPWVAFESRFTTILLQVDGREVRMRLDDDITVRDDGPVAEYEHFRASWDAIRRQVTELLPEHGTTVDGQLTLSRGVISWREAAGTERP